jgi:hypothetical protein
MFRPQEFGPIPPSECCHSGNPVRPIHGGAKQRECKSLQLFYFLSPLKDNFILKIANYY